MWQRFVPSLRKLLSWMFETAVVESICSVCHGDRPGNKKSSRIGVGEAAQTALLREMFAGFYKHCSEQRESVLSFMLNECFVLCGATSLATFTTKQSINYKSWIKKHEEKNRVHRLKKRVKLSRGAGFMGCSVLAPIGSSVVSWGPRGAVGNEHFAAAADIEALGTKITLALVILEDILVDEGTGGPAHSVVLRYLLERFRPSAHEAGGRHRLKLPSPYVLYR